MKRLLTLCLLAIAANSYAADPGYHVIKRLGVGGEGGWDYLTVDAAARRLYIARSSHVMVMDLDSDQVVGDIPGTPGVHGIAVAPELNRGFTSNGKGNSSTIFNLKTLEVLGEVKTGWNPDAIVYDPASKRVFAFNGKSHDATVFEAASGRVVATIPLGGKPEFAAVDGKGKVFVNIEDTNEVVEINSFKARAGHRFALTSCDEPSGLALDAKRGRVFSGCHNQAMTVLDTKAGRVIASVPIGAKVDGCGFDAGTGLAFASNGDGTLTVAREAAPGKFEVAETVPTQAGSRTMVVDPRTHRIYLPAARFLEPKEPQGGARSRPETVPGSFELLVVGK